MDLVVWLRGLGLGQYEAAFRENEIDETVLPSVTHETLKELGVTAVGHRLKLLDAIAALHGDIPAPAPSADRSCDMNRTALQRRLAKTTAQITSGDRRIAQQREIVADLKSNGQPAEHARYLLAGLELLQAAHQKSRKQLLKELLEDSN